MSKHILKEYLADDGFTYYEEWRGFMVKGVHTRTSPIKKDVFIHDHEPFGIGNFDVAATVEPHLINIDEMRGDDAGNFHLRAVNFNRNHAKLEKNQYGIFIFQERIFPPGTLGDSGTAGGTPREVQQYIRIDRTEHNAKMPNCPAYIFTETVIHELGHAIDIEHHGGLFQDESSGVTNCYMRYWTDEEENLLEVGDYSSVVPKSVYCSSDDECYHQIDVSDD